MSEEIKTVSIRISNEEKRMSKAHLIYDSFELSRNDEIIKPLLDEAVKEFGEDPEKIVLTCKLVIQ
jgi:hypothetical protein